MFFIEPDRFYMQHCLGFNMHYLFICHISAYIIVLILYINKQVQRVIGILSKFS